VAQEEGAATLAPEPDDELLAIRWSDAADRIERRVRAASPWPGAYTEIGDAEVTLTRVRATVDVPRALVPGEAFVRRGVPAERGVETDVAVVKAGDGRGVELLQGRCLRGDEEDDLDRKGLARLVAKAVCETPRLA
jgi:hypothetical protein